MSKDLRKTNSKQRNKIPFLILSVILVIVLGGVIWVAARGRGDSGQVENKDYLSGNTEYVEKWQEGVIKHNDKFYKLNPNLDIYLFMGIDKDEEVVMTEEYADGGQSDAMFLLVTNAKEKKVSVISINRNTMTDIVMYDENGAEMSVDEARNRSAAYVEEIKNLKDELIEDSDYGVNSAAALFLDEIKAKILKFKITKEVIREYKTSNLKDMMFYDGYFIYPDEDFKKAEMAAIERLKVQPQDNFFDYYKEDEDETKS